VTTYQMAESDVTEMLQNVMVAFHPELVEADTKVGCLMAENPDGDPVKHGGYPALAAIKVVTLRDRVSKGYDAEMVIDRHEWDQMTDEHREALLDHELSHLVRVPNTKDEREDGELDWKVDDLGRPKLKLRPGDWSAGDGFKAVVARHGRFAAEYLNIQKAKAMADAARDEGAAPPARRDAADSDSDS
jgi:hypothetical protein